MTNAIQFIQQHGVEKAREVVEGAPEGSSKFNVKTEQYLKNIKVATIGYPSSGMVVQACLRGLNKAYSIELSDLKRLVESVDLVEKFGDLEAVKAYVPDGYKSERLNQAIADYEAIYSGEQHV